MFYTDDFVMVTKFKVTMEFYLVNAPPSVGLGLDYLAQMTQIKQLYMYVCTFI